MGGEGRRRERRRGKGKGKGREGKGRERGISPLKHKNLTPPIAKSLILQRHA
jgi:hypothetical protein